MYSGLAQEVFWFSFSAEGTLALNLLRTAQTVPKEFKIKSDSKLYEHITSLRY